MNQARIWLVVKPSIGVPLMLGAVAITALLVHAAVLTHTAWYPAFLNGKAKISTSMIVPAAPSIPGVTIG